MENNRKLPYNIHRLEEGERIESFDCGDDDLNDFILNVAHLYRQELLAVTYVVQDYDTNRTLAYFTLATDKVSLSEFADKTEFNRFRKHRFVNEKRLRSYPSIKLCRIAVDISARNLHLGSMVLNLVKYSCLDDMKFGCRFITVDAYTEAIPFYLKNKFEIMTTSDKDDPHTRVLFYDLKQMTND